MKKKDYVLRNDLAIQNRKYKKINSYISNGIKIERYTYKNFSFTDLIFSNIETEETKRNLKNKLKTEIKLFLKKYKISKKASCLVVGLGNNNIISDALGVMTSKNIIATGYYHILGISSYRNVYVFIPGTTKESGMEAFQGIKALVKEIKPDFVIVIDSLVCSHIKYLNSVIQISDAGITPGSGLASYNEEISLKTIGLPTFMLGVPTATFASTIIRDVMNIKKSHISFKEGYDFMVVSHDIDIIIHDLSNIIAKSLNEVLNNYQEF